MYLERRHRKWWAYHDVPARLREAMGTKRLAQSLGTDDEREAEKRKQMLWLHKWQPELERAERGAPKTPSELERDARFFRELILNADTEEEKEALREAAAEEAQRRAEKAMRAAGVEDPDSPEAEELQGVIDAIRFAKLARGELVPVLDHVDAWLATTGTKPKTQAMQRADLERLSKSLPMVSDVTPEAAQRWVYDIARERDLSAETLKRMLSGLRNYWAYLAGIGLVPKSSKPFSDLTVPTTKKTPERKDFAPEDVVKLRTAATAKGDHQLADLIALGMFTGARREDLCVIKASAVDLVSPIPTLVITNRKTGAPVRTIPIHADLLPTLRRLVEASQGGFILPGLAVDRYGNRGDDIGQRFGKLKTKLGYGPELVFHSLRRTLATMLERAGVPENVAADILGHEKPRITYGYYSGGSGLEAMAEALGRVRYPAAEGGR